MKARLWLGVLILFIAATILPDHMGREALWQDEGSELFMAKQPSLTVMLRMQSYDQHPPLHYIFLYGWVRLIGENLWMWRLPSLWFSLLAVALVFRLGLDLFGWKAALLAASFTLTSDAFYTFSIVIRHYSLYVMFSVLATLCYWRYTRQWDRRTLIAYALSSLLMMYTLYWGVWVLLVHGIHALIFHPRRVLKMAVPALIIILLFLPWLIYARHGLTRSRGSLNTTIDPETGYIGALSLTDDGLKTGMNYVFDEAGLLLTGGTILALLVGLLPLRRWNLSRAALAGLWLLIPVVLPVLITWQTGFAILGTRLLSGTIPALGLVLGIGVRAFPRWLVLSLTAAFLLWRAETHRLLLDEPWWEYTAFIEQNVAWHDGIAMGENNMAYTLESHLELADYPTDRYIPINDTIFGVGDRPGSSILWRERATSQDAIWLLHGSNLRLLDMQIFGYVPTTPRLYIPNETKVPGFWRFARPITTPRLTSFGEILSLLTVDTTRQGDVLLVELNWQPGKLLEEDYVIRVELLDSRSRSVSGHISQPLNGWSPTSQWEPAQLYYDTHQLPLDRAPAGSYQLAIQVSDAAGSWLMLSPCNAAICDTYLVRGITVP